MARQKGSVNEAATVAAPRKKAGRPPTKNIYVQVPQGVRGQSEAVRIRRGRKPVENITHAGPGGDPITPYLPDPSVEQYWTPEAENSAGAGIAILILLLAVLIGFILGTII